MTTTKLEKILPYILLIGSLIGLIAAFTLTYDKIHVLQDPHYKPSCNINPILSCGSVMQKPQASLLGVPNTIFGLMGFSVLMTLASLLLFGVQLPRKIWLGIEAGLLAGLTFAGYLFFQGVFRIHAICPFCFMVWVIMPAMAWYTTLFLWHKQYLPNRIHVTRFLGGHHGDALLLWYLVFAAILLIKFWYYWSTLI